MVANYEIALDNLPGEGVRVEKLGNGGVEFFWTPPASTIVGSDQFSHTHELKAILSVLESGEQDPMVYSKVIPLKVYIESPELREELLSIHVDREPPVFKEGELESFVVTGILSGGVRAQQELTIDGLPEDASTQKLPGGAVRVSWTPALDEVTGGNTLFSKRDIVIRLRAENQEKSVEVTRELSLIVNPASVPLATHLMALDISPNPVSFVEGVESEFTVTGRFQEGVQVAEQKVQLMGLPDGVPQTQVPGGVKVVWRPPLDTVAGEGNFVRTYPVTVKFSARDRGEDSWSTLDQQVNLKVFTDRLPLSEDALAIVTKPMMPVFTEGMERRMKILGKLLGGVKAKYEVSVKGLEELGAKVEKVDGGVEVVWTPPADTITGPNNLTRVYENIEVEMSAWEQDGGPRIVKTEPISLRVNVARPPLAREALVGGVQTPAPGLYRGGSRRGEDHRGIARSDWGRVPGRGAQ